MNADEKVGAGLSRDRDAAAETHKVVRRARENRAHVGFLVDFGGEKLPDREDDVLLARLVAADRTGVFASVTGVYHDDETVLFLGRLLGRLLRGLLVVLRRRHGRLLDGLRGLGGLRGLRLLAVFEVRKQCGEGIVLNVGVVLPFGDARKNLADGVDGDGRIEVEDEAVLVVREGLQLKDLGLHIRFEVHDEAHDPGLILPDAHRLNVGVVRLDGFDLLFERGREVEAFDVDHEPKRARGAHEEVFELERAVVLERDARVFLRRPHAHGDHLGAAREVRGQEGKEQRPGGAGDQFAASHARASKICRPAGVRARRRARRPSPSC